MTIQDWGAIGEIVGAIAVVASLIYLAIQIRQNTAQISRSIESDRFAAFERNATSGNRWRELLLVNKDLADLFTRGARSYRDLDPAERFRFGLLMRNTFSDVQVAFIRNQHVGKEDRNSGGFEHIVTGLFEHPGILEWIERSDVDWHPEFKAAVKEIYAEIKAKEAEMELKEETEEGA